MVVSFNRGARGQNALRQLLSPVVKDIIENKTLGINTNPIDIYKAWVNQIETATGEARWVITYKHNIYEQILIIDISYTMQIVQKKLKRYRIITSSSFAGDSQ